MQLTLRHAQSGETTVHEIPSEEFARTYREGLVWIKWATDLLGRPSPDIEGWGLTPAGERKLAEAGGPWGLWPTMLQ
jgi:hypothetical protein